MPRVQFVVCHVSI